MLPCNEKVIKNKAGLLNLAEELNNVPRAYKVMGFSRDTFYRYKTVVEEGGVDALFDKSRTHTVLFFIETPLRFYASSRLICLFSLFGFSVTPLGNNQSRVLLDKCSGYYLLAI
ncbi:MAG: hypothetical protein LEGION0398_MBIBDBAK_00056 [Legionellaceae bacterium]